MLGYPVDVWSLREPLVVGADGLIGMVVAHDVDDVHGLLRRAVPAAMMRGMGRGGGHGNPCKGENRVFVHVI